MSAERSDSTYQPGRQRKRQTGPVQTRPIRTTRRDKDYSEPLIVSDTDHSSEGEVEIMDNYLKNREYTLSPKTESVKSEPPWTPNTFALKSDNILRNFTEFKEQTELLSMAIGPDTSMVEVMQMMLKLQSDNREADLRRDREREIERQTRDDQLRREAEQREERLLLALKEAQPIVPQTVTIVNQKLPEMKEGEEIEVFVSMFEAALRASNVPEQQWFAKLHAHLNPNTKLRIQDIIQNPDTTYQMIKDALIGCGTLTFSAASEALMSADRGKILALPYRQAVDKMARLLEKVAKEAADEKEIYQYIAIAHTRYHLNPEVKQYVDLKGDFTKENHCRTVEEWQSTQAPGTKWSKKTEIQSNTFARQTNLTTMSRKPGSCFHCGK